MVQLKRFRGLIHIGLSIKIFERFGFKGFEFDTLKPNQIVVDC